YDPKDVSANSTDTNANTHNWIGQVGAWLGYGLFFGFGAGAFVLPILLFCFGLSYLLQLMAYFHRRWVWAAVLLLCCIGLLDLNTSLDALAKLATNPRGADAGILDRAAFHLGAPSAGGWVGLMINKYLFGHFGSVGATILFATLYLISLLFLTNFQLGVWLRGSWEGLPAKAEKDLSAQEKALERRARELERQSRKLQEQFAKAGLGPDLRPVPEPTVRDLSLPQTKPLFRSSVRPRSSLTEPEKEPPPGIEGEVIPANEIAAAATQDLGKPLDELAGSAPLIGEQKDAHSEKARNAAAGEKQADEMPPAVHLPPEPPPRPKAPPKKPKPLAVAPTPLIGNYHVPSLA